MFLWGETPQTMFHVASMMPFTPPADAGPTYLRDLLDRFLHAPVQRPWTLKLSHPSFLAHPLQSWVEDQDFDLDYHVRRSALASPGDERELGVLVSRLHSHQLDFRRPPWEMHIIEGLEGGRFAMYIKVHHALVDGFSAVKLLSRSLSEDPETRNMLPFYSLEPVSPRPRLPEAAASAVDRVTAPVSAIAEGVSAVAKSTVDVSNAVLKLESGRFRDREVVDAFSAPPSMFNGRTGRNRRFATQQYTFDRLRALSRRSGGTLNDVVMAICGGGLRRFLMEQGDLPERPLIAFMPVNIRPEGDQGGGNMVGASLATMGTDIADPIQRLRSVIASTKRAKASMRDMGQLGALAWSGYMLAPQGPQVLSAMTGLPNPLPRAFNICVSNVPGPRHWLYLDGAKMEAVYPMSIPIHGMALNITLESYADTLNFGFIGCRDAVPSLQRLAVYTGQALEELEAAYAARDAAKKERPNAARRAPVRRASAKKAPAKKTAATKTAATKTAAKKTAAKKTTSKTTVAKKKATS